MKDIENKDCECHYPTKTNRFWISMSIIFTLVIVLACQVIPTPPQLTTTPTGIQTSTQFVETLTAPTSSPIPQLEIATLGPSPLLAPFPSPAANFAGIELLVWQGSNNLEPSSSPPLSLDEISNRSVLAGLTNSQRDFLAQNGFVILHSQETQFGDIRERVARFYGQPYYLTTDAAYHALHLTYSELLQALEREELRPRLLSVTEAVLSEVLSYIPDVQGTVLEMDTELAAAYLSVALRLLRPDAELDEGLEPLVAEQVAQIMKAEGRAKSALFPNFEDDYSAYRPVGHYAGDPDLESYYRVMTWYGRMHFPLQPDDSGEPASRLPLIITMALRRAEINDQKTAAQEWTQVNDALTFLIGTSDDYGPPEYAALMDQIYGGDVSLLDLVDEPDWVTFRRMGSELPPPRINSTFVSGLDQMEMERGWRFLGQRFSLDAFIMQNLVFDWVGTPDNRREQPSGLDVMAALESPAAMSALQETGEMAYQNYPERLAALQNSVADQPLQSWLSTAYNVWLFAFHAQVKQKGDDYPAYMNSSGWAYKDLISALGSWSELKHDTTLYIKMPEAAGGGGPPASGPPPCQVEPNPDVFYRLAYLSGTIVDGLSQRDMIGVNDDDELGLAYQLRVMLDLSDRVGRLGDLAAKELTGQTLDQDDCALVLAPLGPVEERVHRSQTMAMFGGPAPEQMPPLPVISAVAGAGEQILQVGVGLVDRIYVVVNFDGELQVAQGGVFSYYEFKRPRVERLSDQVWRQLLTPTNPELPPWTAPYLLPGGVPVDVLAFRRGDTYRVTAAGDQLNMRSDTSLGAGVVYQLEVGEYVIIVDGPVQAAGFTWWKLALALDETISGWAVQNPEWYERAWGQ